MVLNYSPAVTIREWQRHRRRGAEEVHEGDDFEDAGLFDDGGGGEQSAEAPGKSVGFAEWVFAISTMAAVCEAPICTFGVFTASERGGQSTDLLVEGGREQQLFISNTF